MMKTDIHKIKTEQAWNRRNFAHENKTGPIG